MERQKGNKCFQLSGICFSEAIASFNLKMFSCTKAECVKEISHYFFVVVLNCCIDSCFTLRSYHMDLPRFWNDPKHLEPPLKLQPLVREFQQASGQFQGWLVLFLQFVPILFAPLYYCIHFFKGTVPIYQVIATSSQTELVSETQAENLVLYFVQGHNFQGELGGL